jgi:hypothetical protein
VLLQSVSCDVAVCSSEALRYTVHVTSEHAALHCAATVYCLCSDAGESSDEASSTTSSSGSPTAISSSSDSLTAAEAAAASIKASKAEQHKQVGAGITGASLHYHKQVVCATVVHSATVIRELYSCAVRCVALQAVVNYAAATVC